MAPHLAGYEDLKEVHVVDAIFFPVHFIHQHILGYVQDDRPSLVVFAQVVEYFAVVEILEILPFVFSLHVLVPLKVLFEILPSLFEVEVSRDHVPANHLLFLCPEFFLQRIQHFYELAWYLIYQLVLLAKGWVFGFFYFLLNGVLIFQEMSLESLQFHIRFNELLKKCGVAI